MQTRSKTQTANNRLILSFNGNNIHSTTEGYRPGATQPYFRKLSLAEVEKRERSQHTPGQTATQPEENQRQYTATGEREYLINKIRASPYRLISLKEK